MTLTFEHASDAPPRLMPHYTPRHDHARHTALQDKAKRAFERNAGRHAARYMDEALRCGSKGRGGLTASAFRIKCHRLAANQTWYALQRDRAPLDKKLKLAEELRTHIRRSRAFQPSGKPLDFNAGDFSKLYNQLRAAQQPKP